MELFKPIPGHFGYEASDLGSIRNAETKEQVAYYPHPQGYLMANVRARGHKLVHRLVVAAFIGPAGKFWVNHKNGIKTDNRLVNLEYCTPKQNSEHAVHTGLTPMPPGSDKLTAEQVLEIDRRCKAGEAKTVIAGEYGVTPALISHIYTGRAWQWLTGNSEAPKQPKLTMEDRLQIKALLAEGRTGREIAALYGVTPSVVSCIKNGRRNYTT
jgi:hypothetical protein